jgi:hypothetical protein
MRRSTKLIIIGILWPSFWTAIVLSGIFFSLVDPTIIAEEIGLYNISSLGCYTAGFLFFWISSAWSGFFSIVFSRNAYN